MKVSITNMRESKSLRMNAKTSNLSSVYNNKTQLAYKLPLLLGEQLTIRIEAQLPMDLDLRYSNHTTKNKQIALSVKPRESPHPMSTLL